ncbi:SEC-C metal-binding domain-containing protein [Streptomyces mirabilis]|uniref:SEC-C metal-binding domain-containing protein n=1 Tax=Streptomyces mirabilis TaxID=68239 RepID=UPI0033C77422
MVSRRFLTDAELNSVMDHLPDPDVMPIGMLDQIDAASRDTAGMSCTMAAAAAARGDRAFLGTLPDDLARRRGMVRPRLKMMLAAFSARPAHLCGHTNQVRPMLLSCDPPSITCMQPACLAKVDEAVRTTGYRWDHQCDACGHRVDLVYPYLTTLGPLSISGHLCKPCTEAMTEGSTQVADIGDVARKEPCPCGSGRRFKRCHGRAA